MSENLMKAVRRVFESACSDGSSVRPAALEQFVATLTDCPAEAPRAEFENLATAVWAEFSPLHQPLTLGRALEAASLEKWESAVRAVISDLRAWEPNHGLASLAALLATINALDSCSTGLEAIAIQLKRDTLSEGLQTLLSNAEIGPWGGDKGRYPYASGDFKLSSVDDNYDELHRASAHLMTAAGGEVWAAIVLLWRLDSRRLAKVVNDRDDVYFSLQVRLVLKDDAPKLALEVPLVSFKFLAVDQLEEAHRCNREGGNWSGLLEQILIQVAPTSAWKGWMHALVRSPDEQSLMASALPGVLAQVGETNWEMFVETLYLSYSKRSAAAVASILSKFAQLVGQEEAKRMWAICFHRWADWDYGRREAQFSLFAPAACALDYPVAMHFSQLLPNELDDEEAVLTRSVERVEQQWFSTATELVSERNRLLSRLRLIKHGRALAAGTADLLPTAILPPEDAYARVRYWYHDVQFN